MSKKGLIARTSALLLLPAAFAATAFTAVGCGDDAKTPDAGIDAPPPAPAALSITPQTSDFGSVTTGGTSSASVFTVSNTGGSPSGTISAIVTGANATEFTVQNGCSVLVAAGTCSVSVTFAPTTDGAKSATLLVSGSPGGQVMATLAAVAKPPSQLSLAPQGNHAFGQVLVGQTAATPQVFTVTNNGGATTGTITVTAAGADPSQFVKSADGCNGMTLAANATCMFTVNFAPTTSGAKAAEFDVTATPGGAVSAAVSGDAVTNAVIVLSPMIGQFGTVVVGQSDDVTFTGVNSGGTATGTLTTAITGADAAQFSITGNTCAGATLAANGGSTCTVIVHYAPLTQTMGTTSKVAALTLTGTPGGTATATFQALANTPGSLSIGPPPTPHDYMVVQTGQTSNFTFTVTNGGATPIGPLSTALGGTNADQYNVVAGSNACSGATLAGLASCTVVIQFAPTNSGTQSGNFTVTGGTATAQIGLTGIGQSPAALTINTPSHDFGSVTQGNTSPAFIFTIRNSGGTTSGIPAATITGPNAADFSEVSNCTVALAPAATCTVSVTFTANTPNTQKTATLNVTATPGGTITADLSGNSISNAQIAVNPGSLTFIGPDGPNHDSTLVGNSSLTQSFTVINNGATPTTAISIANSGPNAADFTQTNNCTTLTNGQTCTVIVTFTPTNNGHRTATITASAATGGSAGVAVAGDALTKLQLIAPSTNPYDFGTLNIGPTGFATVCVQVRNNSSLPITFTRTYTGFSCNAGVNTGDTCTPTPNSEYHRNGGGCGNQPCGDGDGLAAVGDVFGDDSCGQLVEFQPTMAGVQTASLLFSAGVGPTNNQTQSFTGNGNANALTITPGGTPGNQGFDYGMVASGSSKAQVFTVTNQSGSPAGKLASSINGGTSFHVTSDGCTGLPLAVNASCMITVTYFGFDTSNAQLVVADSTGAVTQASDNLSVSNANPSVITVNGPSGGGTSATSTTTDVFDPSTGTFSGETTTHTFVVTNTNAAGGVCPGATCNPNVKTGPLSIVATGDASFAVQTGAGGDCINGTTIVVDAHDPMPPMGSVTTCNVRVRFAPTGTTFGARTSSLVISGNPGGAVTVKMSGTAVSAVSITPDGNNGTADLGTAVIGGVLGDAAQPPFTTLPFELHNNSHSPVTFTSVTTNDSEFVASVLMGDTCTVGGPISAMNFCTFHVTFTPTGLPGFRGDRYGCDSNGNPTTVPANAGNPCSSINPVTGGANTPSAKAVVMTALASNGTGTAFIYGQADSKAALTITPSSANFGSTSNGSFGQTLQFTITNTSTGPVAPAPFSCGDCDGGQTANAVKPAIATGATSSYVICTATDTPNLGCTFPVGSCATATTFTSLTAGSSCTVQVQFAPKATGALASQLGAAATGTNAAGGTATPSNLTGNGLTATPDVTVTPAAGNFGTQATGTSSAVQTFIFTNHILTPQGFTLSVPTDYAIDAATTTCVSPLAASCTVGVKFAPATVGFKVGTLTMTLTNVGSTEGSLTVGLQGTAIAASVVGGLMDHDFGQVLVGNTSSPFEYVVTNNGAGPITNINVSMVLGGAHSTEFAISGTCQGATIAPLQTCTVDVTWTPTGASTSPITAVMNFSADGLTIPVNLSGTGRNAVSLSISPTTAQDDGTRAIAHLDGTPTIFTVTNAMLSAKTNGLLIHIPFGSCADGTNLSPPYTTVPVGSCVPGDPDDFTLTTTGVTNACDISGYLLFQQNGMFVPGTMVTHQVLDGGQSCNVGVLYSPSRGPSPIDPATKMPTAKYDGTTVTIDGNVTFNANGFGFESDCPTSATCVHGTLTGSSTDTLAGPTAAVSVGSGQPVVITFTNNGTIATNAVRVDQGNLNDNCTTPAPPAAPTGCSLDVTPQVSIVGDTCTGMAIAPAGTCTVTVRFDSNGQGFTSTSFTLHASVSETEPPWGEQHTHHQQLAVTLVP